MKVNDILYEEGTTRNSLKCDIPQEEIRNYHENMQENMMYYVWQN